MSIPLLGAPLLSRGSLSVVFDSLFHSVWDVIFSVFAPRACQPLSRMI